MSTFPGWIFHLETCFVPLEISSGEQIYRGEQIMREEKRQKRDVGQHVSVHLG